MTFWPLSDSFLAAFYIIIGAIKSPSNPIPKKTDGKGEAF